MQLPFEHDHHGPYFVQTLQMGWHFLVCFIRYTIQMPVFILFLLFFVFAFSFSCLTQFFMAFYQYQKNDFYVTGEVISF